jgi:hypothetical protein
MPIQRVAPYPDQPRPMRLTDRDRQMLETIHAFDGVMSAPQFQRYFFNSWRTTRERLSLLWQNGYLGKPSRKARAALPYMIYWLGEQGAQVVADREGTQFAKFEWVKEARWSQVEHDMAVGDFRLDVMEAVTNPSFIDLGIWISEGVFRSWRDKVVFTHKGAKATKVVMPDGYFELWIGTKRFRLLVEIDRSTKDNPRFAFEKARPFLAYIRSDIYKERFGYNAGRILVITTSQRRLRNMKAMTEDTLGGSAGAFFFSTCELVQPNTVLTEPIWHVGGKSEPEALFIEG